MEKGRPPFRFSSPSFLLSLPLPPLLFTSLLSAHFFLPFLLFPLPFLSLRPCRHSSCIIERNNERFAIFSYVRLQR